MLSFLLITDLIWFFILGLYLFPQPIFAKILSAPSTIQVSPGESVTGQVKVASPQGGSCLKAMSAKGPLPGGLTIDFTPECGSGNWDSNYKAKAINTAVPGTYQIGFVEIPKSGPPAVSVKQVKLLVIVETSPTSPQDESTRGLPLSPFFTPIGILLVSLFGLGLLLGRLRGARCKGCDCEEIKVEKGKSKIMASIYKKQLMFCQKCDSMLDQQTKFCEHCVKFQKTSRQEEISHVAIVIPASYAIKCAQTKPREECFASIFSYLKSKEWTGAALEKDITKGLSAKFKQMKLKVANEKINPSEFKCKGKCDGKPPKNPTLWNLNYEAAIITGERDSRVGIDENNPLRGKLVFEIVGMDCGYNEALEVEVELTFTQFKQTGMEGLDKKGYATVGVKTKGFFKKKEKNESEEDYEKKAWTPKKEK